MGIEQLKTGKTCTMDTPEGSIDYLVMFPEGFKEKYTRASGNTVSVVILVAWDDAASFKYYGLGFTTGVAGEDNFRRQIPLACPWAENMWLADLDSVNVGNLPESDAFDATTFEADLAFENWPRCGWIAYTATFVSLNWFPISDDDLLPSSDPLELQRYMRVTTRTQPKERKVPGFTFETDEATPIAINEVGFFAVYEEELIYTMMEVPEELRPNFTALIGKVNEDTFDGRLAGTLLFKGVAGEQQPYIGPNGERYFDVPYMFGYRPDGWNYSPVGFDAAGGPVFKPIRQKGATTGTKRPYAEADFSPLFKPSA